MNTGKIIYWVSTGLMCLVFAYSAQMYFFNLEMVQSVFENFGFAAWIVLPLAITKVLGMIAVLTRKSDMLKEWAYAGFFFDAVLATAAHHYAGDGILGSSTLAIVFVLVSYIYEKKN